MDVAWVTSWVTWGWTPLSRFSTEVLVRIFLENSLELRIALVRYQLREMGY